MRLARTPGASVSEKGQCEYFASLVFPQMITKLQSLGALPTSPNSVVGDFYHHNEDEQKTYETLKGSITEIETIALESGIPNEIVDREIKVLKEIVEKKEIEAKIQDLNQHVKEKESNDNLNQKSN